MPQNTKMEVMYQRRCANYVYQVPEGLRELMSDISREVLRHQPNEIYSFIADYLEALMVTRENARVAAKTISNIAEASEVVAELMRRTSMTPAQANKVVLVIQKAFRKHLRHRHTQHEPIEQMPLLEKICKKCNLSMRTAEKAVIVIQRAYRQFRLRREQELQKDRIDWKTAFFNTMRTYRHAGATKEELNRSASLIKAAYKGYYTRRVIKRFLDDHPVPVAHEKLFPAEGEELDLPLHRTPSWNVQQTEQYRTNRAATIIQTRFREYAAKKARMTSDQNDLENGEQKNEEKEYEFLKSDEALIGDIDPETGPDELKRYVETEGFHAMVEEIRLSTIEMNAFDLDRKGEGQEEPSKGLVGDDSEEVPIEPKIKDT